MGAAAAALFLLAIPTDAVASEGLQAKALACVCKTKSCKQERAAEISEKVEALEAIAKEHRGHMPERLRAPFLVAVACGESGFRERPTCGGDPRCNDSGTSGGMFQIKIKGSIARAFEKEHGRALDVFDFREAAKWYLVTMERAHSRTLADCAGLSRMGADVAWSVTLYRVGRGPTVAKARPGRVVCLDGLCTPVEGVPRVGRCSDGSRYARWARRWIR